MSLKFKKEDSHSDFWTKYYETTTPELSDEEVAIYNIEK
jgi:hypothetical protein